ncbi:hypothetical protein [Dubosiella muris]|uniref:hypothetical protein n=1 Tax=Dubosiella muris TaxID=3038133 RepID=UPI00109421DE|nr:hypothetical protein [Dubosiella muris]
MESPFLLLATILIRSILLRTHIRGDQGFDIRAERFVREPLDHFFFGILVKSNAFEDGVLLIVFVASTDLSRT